MQLPVDLPPASRPPERGVEFREPVSTAAAHARRLPAQTLSALTVLDDRRALLAVAQTVVLAAGTIAAAIVIDRWWATALAVVLVATQQHALFVLAHEAAHYRLFSSRRMNDAAGRLVASLAGISMCTYRVIHRLHHNHLFGELDPDLALTGGWPRGRAYLLKKLATDMTGITAVKTYAYFFGSPSRNTALSAGDHGASRPLDDTSPALRAAADADRRGVILLQATIPVALVLGGWAAARWAPTGAWTAMSPWTPPAWWLLLWVLPAVTVLQAILRLRAVFEHGAPGGVDSPLTAARTNVAGPIARLALFPHHVNYHVEHHLYPAVPHYRLPALHAALAEQGSLSQAEVRDWRDTWRRVYAPRAAR